MKRGGSKLSTRKRTSFAAALQAKNKHIVFCPKNKTYLAFGQISFAFDDFALGFLRFDSQRGDLCDGMLVVIIGPVVPQIWSLKEAFRQIWTLHRCLFRTQRVNFDVLASICSPCLITTEEQTIRNISAETAQV